MIIRCSCEHEQQDAMHGKGNRVANPCKDGAALRCTVCGREHENKGRYSLPQGKKK